MNATKVKLSSHSDTGAAQSGHGLLGVNLGAGKMPRTSNRRNPPPPTLEEDPEKLTPRSRKVGKH